MNGYELSRNWFDFSFENPELISPNHSAIFFFAIEHCNRLGWKKKFGLPSKMAMEAIGIKSYHTYIKAFNELVSWGFIELIEKSKNQYSSNIIALAKNSKALDKALDKALSKHASKHCQSTRQSNCTIDKQVTIEQLNNKQGNKAKLKFHPPPMNEVKDYFFEKVQNLDIAQAQAEAFMDHYISNGWLIGGRSKMRDWRAAVRNWCKNIKKFENGRQNNEIGGHLTAEQKEYLISRRDI